MPTGGVLGRCDATPEHRIRVVVGSGSVSVGRGTTSDTLVTLGMEIAWQVR